MYPAKPLFVPATSEIFSRLDNDTNWIAEVKKNGWRCMVRVTPASKIELWTRHKTIEMSPLPNVRSELASLSLPPDTILDGELLEHRGKTKDTLMLWGILKYNGIFYHDIPYKQQMWEVASLVPTTKHLIKPEFVFEGKNNFYVEVLKGAPENEGIVLKKLDAPVPFSWTSCPSIRTWLKIKPNA